MKLNKTTIPIAVIGMDAITREQIHRRSCGSMFSVAAVSSGGFQHAVFPLKSTIMKTENRSIEPMPEWLR